MTAEQNEKEPSFPGEHEIDAGSDWEDAFQAEDYLIPTETAPPTSQAEDATQEETVVSGGPEEGLAAGPDSQATGKVPASRFAAFLEFLGKKPLIATLFNHLPGPLRQRPVCRTPKGRGLLVMLTAVLSIGLLFSLSILAEKEEIDGGKESAVVVATGNGAGEAIEKKPALQLSVKPAPPASEDASSSSSPPSVETGRQELTQIDSSRRKWRFSSFMIDATQQDEAQPSYVVVDLSLMLRLGQGEDFPAGKEYAIREMIYQFFSNRPLYELRRFSLARGEMKQKLEAWFQKEWPDNPIESVFFNRYRII